MRNQIASIGINQSEETYLLAPKSLYKGEPLFKVTKLRKLALPKKCQFKNELDHFLDTEHIIHFKDNQNNFPIIRTLFRSSRILYR